MPTPNTNADWTAGPAKWAAVVILGGASLAGMGWSIFGREPRPILVPRHAGAPAGATAPAPIADRDEGALPRGADADGEATPGPVAPEAAPGVAPAATRLETRLVNLNTATAAELELLPGIGPALAARIVEHRRSNGPFKSVEELDLVRGIGPRTMDALRPLVTIK
ncbi:MAG: ComEA family DNA-binding protein [Phycisphaerales bacterium]